MVVKNPQNTNNYRYFQDAEDVRTPEYNFVKFFNVMVIIAYLVSSIWIFFFIFYQARWEYNLNYENARAAAAIVTWKWWTVFTVILADIWTVTFLAKAVWAENHNLLLILSVLSYVFAIWGICNVYLRGSIVCFVLPFTIGTVSVIQFYLTRLENKDFKLSQELRIRQQPPRTMETFLDDHEREVERI